MMSEFDKDKDRRASSFIDRSTFIPTDPNKKVEEIIKVRIGTPTYASVCALAVINALEKAGVEQPSFRMFKDGSGIFFIPPTTSNTKLRANDWAQIINLIQPEACATDESNIDLNFSKLKYDGVRITFTKEMREFSNFKELESFAFEDKSEEKERQ